MQTRPTYPRLTPALEALLNALQALNESLSRLDLMLAEVPNA